MNIVVISLFIVTFLPVLLAISSIPLRVKAFGTADINNPRAQAAKFEGLGERISHAQSNSWEALGLYSASLIAMTITQADFNSISMPATVFVFARVLHALFYALNLGILRFLSFLVATACVFWIFVTALTAL